MIAFAGMLCSAADKVGMKYPKDPDTYVENKNEYPHFFVFCMAQLARPIRMGEQFDNAEIIAKIPDDKIMKVSLNDLLKLGISWQQ